MPATVLSTAHARNVVILITTTSALQVAVAFSPGAAVPSAAIQRLPSMLLSEETLRRSARSARALWRTARPSFRSSFTLVRQVSKHVVHDEDVKRDLLENIVDSFLDNGLGDVARTVVNAAPHPHYQKLASVVQSSLASPHLQVPGGVGQHVAAHTVSHAHLLMPDVAIANLHIAGSLPLWAVVPGIAAAAVANKITPIGRKDNSEGTRGGAHIPLTAIASQTLSALL